MFWFIADLGFLFFFFLIKSLIFVFRFAETCLFAFFCEVVHFLFRSFSPNPFPPSNTTISLSLFFFFSCWLSSAYDLIWMFVAFLTATGVVSLKSYFAIQYQNCNFIIRYLTYSTCTLLLCLFFFFTLIYLYLFIHFSFCFALIF